MAIFAPVYTIEQLRGAVNFFEKYPSEGEITRLLSLRCPDRPRWRLTTSHVQLLTQIPDDQQRAALEEKCAEEAYTARTLATELQEMRGKQKNSGRTHQAPKGLKQQLHDLLQHQRRWITRSESLWLNEKRDNIYDDIANASPSKFDATTQGYFAEIVENFDKMSDLVADHRAMCAKIQEELRNREEDADDEDEESDDSVRHRSDMTR
jgi:t-SNARE complex subunit (syntaxin)